MHQEIKNETSDVKIVAREVIVNDKSNTDVEEMESETQYSTGTMPQRYRKQCHPEHCKIK